MNSLPTSGYELPDRYEKDLLHAMAQGPETLHAYWEVSNRKRWLCSQQFECDYGALPKVLRIYDVTAVYFNGHNANGFFDIETTPEAVSWYIYGLIPGAVYLADLGVYTLERQFVPLLRANPVQLPRNAEAPWGSPIVPVALQAQSQHPAFGRIVPSDFENFNLYSNCMK
ncbi:DUF4912 domain-containing protein [Paenibacillus allorhizosphaerae]|uniref:DUF4912 domain-containing protein n=1 Tax=Paenibacillus allorhizosphaerae TaxID=2849866 RepID=A0ABN7TM44_9BACL|nr:DUF4912 domain-containing protein [Paenibacillus allorhizosphaerae]CAG7646651.1 hypothetical protein PAECIP111802_03798 [Paenibacillus allorhizosphaerae]